MDKPKPSNLTPGLGDSSIMGFQSNDMFKGASGTLKSKPTTPSKLKATEVLSSTLSV